MNGNALREGPVSEPLFIVMSRHPFRGWEPVGKPMPAAKARSEVMYQWVMARPAYAKPIIEIAGPRPAGEVVPFPKEFKRSTGNE